MKIYSHALMFSLIVVSYIDPMDTSPQEGKKSSPHFRAEQKKQKWRDLFSFQLGHTDKEPDEVSFMIERGRSTSLFYIKLIKQMLPKSYSEEVTVAVNCKSDKENDSGLGAFRQNYGLTEKNSSQKLYKDDELPYICTTVMSLCIEQEKRTRDGKPMTTISDCLSVMARGLTISETDKLFSND